MNTVIILLALSHILLVALPLFLDSRGVGRRADLFSPLLFDAIMLAPGLLAPFFVVFGGWETQWFGIDPDRVGPLMVQVLGLTVVGRVFLLIGYYGKAGRGIARSLPIVAGWGGRERIWIVALSVVAGAAIVESVFFQGFGGMGSYLSNIYHRRWALQGNFYLLLPVTALAPAAVIVAWRFELIRSCRRRRLSASAALAGILAVLVVLMILAFGGRGAGLRVILYLAVVFHYSFRRFRAHELVVLGFALAVVAGVLGEVRGRTISGSFESEYFQESISEIDTSESLLRRTFGDTGGLERTMVVVEGVPEEIPFQFWTTYSRIFTTIIPRAWWPGKPGLGEASVYGPLFGLNSQGRYGSYPAGSVGDYYLQAGAVGVCIMYFVSGVYRRALYEYISIHRATFSSVLFYTLLLVGESYKLRNQFIVMGLLNALALLLVLRFVNRGFRVIRPRTVSAGRGFQGFSES